MEMEHRVILVREWDAQVSASGCCGRIGGKGSEVGDGEDFAHNRVEMEKMGEVYRALKKALFDEDVELTVVDPRNAVWLVPALLKDARRNGLPLRDMWRGVTKGVSYNSVVVDGKVLFSGRIPRPEDAVAAVRAEIGATT